jgi:hypothetical protein
MHQPNKCINVFRKGEIYHCRYNIFELLYQRIVHEVT